MKFAVVLFVTLAILAFVEASPIGDNNQGLVGLDMAEMEKTLASVLCGENEGNQADASEGQPGAGKGKGKGKARKGKGGKKGNKPSTTPGTNDDSE